MYMDNSGTHLDEAPPLQIPYCFIVSLRTARSYFDLAYCEPLNNNNFLSFPFILGRLKIQIPLSLQGLKLHPSGFNMLQFCI